MNAHDERRGFQAASYGAIQSETGDTRAGMDIADIFENLGSRHCHIHHLLFQWMLACCCAGIVIPSPYVVPALQHEFEIGHATAALVGSCVLIGAMLGVIMLGPSTDRFGRRMVLTMLVPLTGVLAAVHMWLPAGPGLVPLLMLFSLRTALGVCFGGMTIISIPYFLEFLDSERRGAWVSAASLGWTWATVYVLMVAWTFEGDWRLVLSVSCAPVLPALIMVMLWAPESPRWLYVVGRNAEGHQVLEKMFDSPVLDISWIFGKPSKPMQPLEQCPEHVYVQQHGLDGDGEQSTRADIEELMAPRLRRALLAAMLVAISAATASHAAMFALPVILKRFLGASTFHYELFLWNEVAGLVGLAAVMFLLDPLGRRVFLIGIYSFCTCCMMMYLFVPRTEFALFSIYLISGAVWSGIWPAYGAYTAEAFPTRLRGTANGFIVFWARLSAAVSPIMVGWLLDMESNAETAALVFISCLLSLGILGGILIPKETAREKVLDT